jgi:squalene/oxidosqualene cyclase-like protein
VLERRQAPSGSWQEEYAGTIFLTPYYVGTLHILGEPVDPEMREGVGRFLRSRQNADGGWGLDVESPSYVLGSVLSYVAMRLLGVPASDPALERARAWFLPRGGALTSASWGKFLLALLGLFEYEGLNPIQPELWLLPESAPLHPSRMWCHTRMVYLPMSYLYAKRVKADLSPLLTQLREEIYPVPYAEVDWEAHRGEVAPSDSYVPHSLAMRASHSALTLYERFHSRAIRDRALKHVLEHIRVEDESTDYLCIGPLNKLLNLLVWHHEDPGGAQERRHRQRLPEYLHRSADGWKMGSYNSAELWDTALSVQAVLATGQQEHFRPMLARAQGFIEASQLRDEVPERERYHRDRRRGGWTYSTRAQGWPVTDCTAEAMKALLQMRSLKLEAPQVNRRRLAEAADLLLEYQNDNGGWPTYEKTRGPQWLEWFNPSDAYAEIMLDHSYIECTSSCIQALALYLKEEPVEVQRRAAIERAIENGKDFLLRTQREDGSWEGFWGVCFTYGTWFAIEGLLAAGVDVNDAVIQAGADFIERHQLHDGGWGETVESSRQRRYVHAEAGQTVTTSWALLGLAAAGRQRSSAAQRGVEFLKSTQSEDGKWPRGRIACVTSRNCGVDDASYPYFFPMWALAACGEAAARE